MKRIWGVFWMIIAALGGRVVYDLIQFPSEAESAILLGLSRNKLVLVGFVAVLSVIFLIGGITALAEKNNAFSSGKLAGILAHVTVFLILAGYVLLNPPVGNTATDASLRERLVPMLYWGMAFVILAAILLLIQEGKRIGQFISVSWKALLVGILILGLFTGGLYYALQSGVGVDPSSRTFYRQGVSLLEGQILFPLLILYPFMFLYSLIAPRISGKKVSVVFYCIAVFIVWGAAVYFWRTTEFVGRSYFAPALRAPNYNFYPASDAENYDLLAQSVVMGNGFRNGLTVVRPLYVAFLAMLHAFFGDNYMALTNGQIVLLALIPVVVFAIGKCLRSTPAGLLAAAWVIWREVYSIRLTPYVQVSNSRLLLSDLPTTLVVAALILCAAKWARYKQKSVRAFLCGGLIGTAMLIRTQCFVLIPALWLLILCSGSSTSGKKARYLLLSLLGLAIVYVPWFVWGKIYPNTTVNPDTSEGQYLTSLYRDALEVEDPDMSVAAMIMKNPGKTFKAVSSHFLNNEISSLLVLPVRDLPQDKEKLFFDDDLFWYRENARETLEQNRVLIIVYL